MRSGANVKILLNKYEIYPYQHPTCVPSTQVILDDNWDSVFAFFLMR